MPTSCLLLRRRLASEASHVALRSRRWLVRWWCPVAGPLNHGFVESFGIVYEIPEPVVFRSKHGVFGVSDSVDQRPDHIN